MSPNSRPDRVTSSSPKGQRVAREGALRVLLVEDSELLVQRITELVDDLADIEIVGTAGTEAEALARLEAGDIDAVILDLQLHSGSGFGILRALHRREAPPTVIVFTNFAIGAYRDTALALGAQHFLDKSRDYHRLPAVLRELSDSMH
ncbi:MAG TPA: response regulator [Steroidobacteraceae bacterium]|nr:response regulator [Steroidobacteraceae bacterium]